MQIPGPAPLVTQSASVEHATHALDFTSQIGFVGSALQSALAALTHCTQAPAGPQTGRVASRDAQAAPSPTTVASQDLHDPVSQIGLSARNTGVHERAGESGGPFEDALFARRTVLIVLAVRRPQLAFAAARREG